MKTLKQKTIMKTLWIVAFLVSIPIALLISGQKTHALHDTFAWTVRPGVSSSSYIELKKQCDNLNDAIQNISNNKNKNTLKKNYKKLCSKPKNGNDAKKKIPQVKKLVVNARKAAKNKARERYGKECKTKAQKKTKKCKNLKKIIDGSSGVSSGKLGATPGALKKIDAKSVGVSTAAADNTALKNILNGVYQIAGVVAVIIIIIAGVRMITGGDNPDSVATARRAIIYAAAGLVIIISAFVITQFVISAGST